MFKKKEQEKQHVESNFFDHFEKVTDEELNEISGGSILGILEAIDYAMHPSPGNGFTPNGYVTYSPSYQYNPYSDF